MEPKDMSDLELKAAIYDELYSIQVLQLKANEHAKKRDRLQAELNKRILKES